ncbi:glutathione S-transferase [Fusarium oxysporum f. sp. lycopersici 4287]|uniref:Glutathione S-transferase n=3 Tax=Fusarium oxysporum TaxID=5507 RepID=A0A0J9VLJ4_FUSO4|nr:glutathione S-transferase [Fusarium oxysporum f. sp. lycopersici 4287]EXK30167.1 glutathione S-transferase [Fusarium oxysporum f. sp. melonis 26406]KAJ9418527.1 glutathione S-transferase [Fusarium oxysporum]KNB11646.1 glutathione S-transferase [Fusarium oxysporum f. sp. lycopersici 4287]
MSQPDPKRVKTDDDAPYELIYWPVIPGRGEFVRLVFEEAGVPYSDVAQHIEKGMNAVKSLTSTDNIGDEHNPPALAPPALKHGDLLISQTPNILLYVAPRLGLAPKEGNGVYHLNEIVLTILDGLVNELHDTHHPIAISLYYEDQKEESKKKSKYFIKERLPKYFKYMQRVLDAKTSGEGPWLYGDSLTYADLVLFQAVDGTKFAFPKSTEALKKSGEYDGVFKLYDAVKERPNISKYLQSDRRRKYSEGIWRYYPELEEA